MVLALGRRILRESCWLAALMCVCAAFPLASIAADGDSYSATEKSHWSLQPRGMVRPPDVDPANAKDFIRGPVDAFVLQRLTKAGLQPAGEAERLVLARR